MTRQKKAAGGKPATGAGNDAANAITDLDYTPNGRDGQTPSNGFESPNYTQIPNDLLGLDNEPGYMVDMELCELKVVLAICRLTFGFHREIVRRSLPIIEKMTGLSTPSVRKGAEAAEKRGLIRRVSKRGRGHISEWEVIFNPIDSYAEKSDQLWSEFLNLLHSLPDEEKAAFLEKAKSFTLLEDEEGVKGKNSYPFTEEKGKSFSTKGKKFYPHETNKKEIKQRGKKTEQQQPEKKDSVVADLLSNFGIKEPTLTKILALNPAEADVRLCIDYADRQNDIRNKQGFVASMLLAGDLPPADEKASKKKWYETGIAEGLSKEEIFLKPGDSLSEEQKQMLADLEKTVEEATSLGPRAK